MFSIFQIGPSVARSMLFLLIVGLSSEMVDAQSLNVHIRAIERVSRDRTKPNYRVGIKACNGVAELGPRAKDAQAALLEAVNCEGEKLPGIGDDPTRSDDWRGYFEFRKAAVLALAKIDGDGDEISLELANCLRGLNDEFCQRMVGAEVDHGGGLVVRHPFIPDPQCAALFKSFYREIMNCLMAYESESAAALDVIAEFAELPIPKKFPDNVESNTETHFVLLMDPMAAIAAIKAIGQIATIENRDAVQTLEELAAFNDDSRIKSAAKSALQKVKSKK